MDVLEVKAKHKFDINDPQLLLILINSKRQTNPISCIFTEERHYNQRECDG